jgi:uncharacterized sulfatase
MRGKKGSVYEGGHRVACLVRWPGHFDAGRRVHALTCHRDWLPTLIELCELKSPQALRFDGRSIVPLLSGQERDWPRRTFFVDRQLDRIKKAGTGRFPPYAVLTEDWRLVNGELYDIVRDPGQRLDVAKRHPGIASSLLSAYESWFEDAASHGGAFTRFYIGSARENPTTFTVRDWHPTEGSVIWQQAHLDDDARFINGFWAIEVTRPGRYAIRLSRYPADALQPMGASEAKLTVGPWSLRKPVDPADRFTTFETKLEQGPAILKTWLTDSRTQQTRGAYFVSCQWLSAS